MQGKVDTSSLLPRYAQARKYLEDLIRSVPYRPGDQLPAERDLANAFEVSQMTMNRAIQEMVREGALMREVGRGTFVRQRFEASRNGTIGLVTLFSPSYLTQAPYAADILRGAREVAAAIDRDLLLIQESMYEPEGMDARLYGRADGFIVMCPPDEALTALRNLRARGVPFVCVGSSWESESIPAVDSDNFLGASQAVDHLRMLGHQRIGLVGAPEDLSNGRDRRLGFVESLERAGLPVCENWVLRCESPGPLNDPEKRRLMEIVCPPDGATALFAAGYELAICVIETLLSRGICVPDEVSVVGFDDNFSAAFLKPSLTTVLQPLEEMGARAAERLDAMLRAQSLGIPMDGSPYVERLPTTLIIRHSCAPALNGRP